MTDFFLSQMNLNLILPPIGGRRPPKGEKYFYRAPIPVDWAPLVESAINVRYRTLDAAPQLVLSLSREPILGFPSTLYLSLMGKLNIQPIKDGHVYLLQEACKGLIEFH